MDHSTPAFPVLHYLMEFAQIHVHWANVKVKESEVAQSCLTLCDPVDCRSSVPPSMGFSRQEYWSGLPFPSPGESSPARDQTWISCIVGRFFTNWATREAALSQSCLPNISSFVAPFSSSPHSFLASGSFLWVSSLHQVAKVLQLQLQSFQCIFRIDFL